MPLGLQRAGVFCAGTRRAAAGSAHNNLGGSLPRRLNRHRSTALAGAALVASVLMVSGCASGSSGAPAATPRQAEEITTSSAVDAPIAAIDPSLIDHVDLVMNASVGCLWGWKCA